MSRCRLPSSGRLWWAFGADCALATSVRLVLAWATGGYTTDLLAFQSWAATLRDHPIGNFYASAQSADHLPGDLWLLKATESLFTFLGGRNLYGRDFALLTQVVPILGDLLTGLMLLLIARRVAGVSVAGSCARWYLLNPATIMLTGVWGQWDSVSLGIFLTGTWLLFTEDWRWLASAPLFAWAVLVKPQLAIALVCLLPLVWRRCRATTRQRPPAGRALTGASAVAWMGAGVLTAYALLAPFRVHLLFASGEGSTLVQRIRVAYDLYPFTTVGAANMWMLPIHSLDRVRDVSPAAMGLTPQQWGNVLFALGLLVVAFIWWHFRRRFDHLVTVTWAASVSMLVGFLLTTRVHERYALPVLGLILVLLATQRLDRRLALWFWLASLCLTLNQVLVLFGGFEGPGGHRLYFNGGWWTALSSAYLILGAFLIGWPWWARDHEPCEDDEVVSDGSSTE